MRIPTGLGLVIVAVGLLAVMAYTGAAAHGWIAPLAMSALALAAVVGAVGLARLAQRWELRVEELRGWVNVVAGQSDIVRREVAPDADSVDRVQLAIIDMIGLRLDQQSTIYRRLEEVLNALPDGVVVVTQEGLISLVNAAGRPLFGAAESVIGKSIFDTLSRQSMSDAIERARFAGRPLAVELQTVWSGFLPATIALIGEEGSALLRYAAAEGESVGGEHDLSLHDRPLPPESLRPEMPLSGMPAFAIDTETTGLNPKHDRVISVGGIRLQGARLHRSSTINLLVNPGRTIPNRTIAVHGISNSMVANAPRFAAVAAEVAAATDGLVLIGHHIGFDVHMLRNEMEHCGRSWLPAHSLDVMLLYAGLFPDRSALLLDDIAGALDVPVIGRHSALGDALTTAEIYSRLIPILIDRGIDTLGAVAALQVEAAVRLSRKSARRGLAGGP